MIGIFLGWRGSTDPVDDLTTSLAEHVPSEKFIHTFAGVVDWKSGIAEGFEKAFELGNQSLCSGNVIALELKISSRCTDLQTIS
jgi:hypothetical protein